jgi:hypothetical protein
MGSDVGVPRSGSIGGGPVEWVTWRVSYDGVQ